ncbi:MAG: hypothetical protein QJR08_02480 [Bacillota bacterium]|nr:hypothetical protein [Bacillota bacterium]
MNSLDKRWKAAPVVALLAGLFLGTLLAGARLDGLGSSRPPAAAPASAVSPAGAAGRPEPESLPVMARLDPGRLAARSCGSGTGSQADARALGLPPPLAGWLGLAGRDPEGAARAFEGLARTPLFRPAMAAALRTPGLRQALAEAARALRRQKPRPDAAWAQATLACAGGQGWSAALAAIARDAAREPALARQLAWTLRQPGAAPLAPWLRALLQAAAKSPAGGR